LNIEHFIYHVKFVVQHVLYGHITSALRTDMWPGGDIKENMIIVVVRFTFRMFFNFCSIEKM